MPKLSQSKLKSNLQKTLCQNIMDTRDVVKSQVFASVQTKVASQDLNLDELKSLKSELDAVVDKQTDRLIDLVIKETS